MSRYETMLELRNRVDELLAQCGLEASGITVHSVKAPMRMVEALGHDRRLCSYLDALCGQIQKVDKAIDRIKVDLWSMEQDEQRIDALEQELAEYKKCSQQMWRVQEESHAHIVKQSNDTAELEYNPQKHLNLIQAVIGMRDRLLMSQDWLQDQDPDNLNAAKLICTQLRETRNLLERAGVEVLDQGGQFDCTFQTVVDTRPAPSPQQVDEIANTFRPGYRMGGETLRAQEVIVFV